MSTLHPSDMLDPDRNLATSFVALAEGVSVTSQVGPLTSLMLADVSDDSDSHGVPKPSVSKSSLRARL